MNWIPISIYWYGMLFFLGLIFYPFTKKLFGVFFIDKGYAFSKIIGILILSYTMFLFGTLKMLPFTNPTLLILLFIFVIWNCYVWKYHNSSKNKTHRFLIVFEEILFVVSFFFWILVRGQEPSIRGLEKFMDFGFINSILRSKFFPPLDMWLSGYPINYYYFGHLTGAVLIKLSNIKPSIGYNLILTTIFALSVTQVFSLVLNMVFNYMRHIKGFVLNFFSMLKMVFFGILGAFIVNLGGNLHTIYIFTSGYPNEKPIPFWQILGGYNPAKYWYPNATRFIPFTIHEFPIYSYIVADLHGHVFDIPFVLLTLAVLFKLFVSFKDRQTHIVEKILNSKFLILNSILLGFLCAVHYMTNAFDGPIYMLLCCIIFVVLFRFSKQALIAAGTLIVSFVVFSLPFSVNFSPFVSGIGVNCSPDFLVEIGKIGPFLFEKNNCQISPPWMLFILWGFFWMSFLLYIILLWRKYIRNNNFILILFLFGTALIIIPEFFYIKDIYPAHFRANTMFKLGYQAFIMMGIASLYVFFQIKMLRGIKHFFFAGIFLFFFFFIAIYPLSAIPSFYGQLNRPVELDGSVWFTTTFPEDKEIIDYLNKNISDQPVILEAQGDSYTDYERISAYTGLPTVAGWWVHEWLWRGSPDVVGKKIPDVISLYESKDLELTKSLINKYHIRYVVVSKLEKQKYLQLYEEKFEAIGKRIFQSKNKLGALYQVNFD
jgi:YYY domain-containing protein